MQKRHLKLVLTLLALLVSWRPHAQVYSQQIISGHTYYRTLYSLTLPFFPYHYAVTERSWYEDANGAWIIDAGHEQARGGILHQALEVECGLESFTVPLPPPPPKAVQIPNGPSNATPRLLPPSGLRVN